MAATGPALEVDEMIPGTKYRVVKALGAGGMGVVYQVVKPPNIQGVLKVMSSELAEHEEHLLRFFDEVRILAQLDHPNIVKVFDYDALPDGTPFYVMEVLSGRTVRDVITTIGRVPPRVAYEITRQLLEALQAAHTHEVPVIHRDIKPENIFLHAPRHGEPVLKLIDFGVSSVADRKHDGAFVGTWSYAAPEQIRGSKPTPATDLYAAGLVLYEMLAGVGPFDHYDDWAKVSKAQLDEIPAPVSKFAPWVPASIVALIQSALAKDPAERPRDAYAFAERLFELEWASDGKDPHDLTAEGPSPPSKKTPHVAPGAGIGAAVAGAIAEAKADAQAPGPLSRVLSSVTSATAKASSKKMAAASPAADRLGDIPLIGVPPEFVRTGPTWRGVGGKDHTSPNPDSLLAGFDIPPGKPIAKRERESDPEVAGGATPRGRMIIKAGRNPSSGHEQVAPTTPRRAITLDEPIPSGAPAVAARDTFSSQQSDAGRTIPKSRTGVYLLAGLLVLGGAVAAVAVVFGNRPPVPATGSVQVQTQMTATPVSSTPVAATTNAMIPDPPPSAPTASAAPTPTTKHGGRGKPGAAAASKASASAAPASAPAAAPTTSASSNGDFIRAL
jgi:serine/threonine protein kinase